MFRFIQRLAGSALLAFFASGCQSGSCDTACQRLEECWEISIDIPSCVDACEDDSDVADCVLSASDCEEVKSCEP